MKVGKALIAGLVIWVVKSALGFLTCGWLFNWVYKLPPNIWKTDEAIKEIWNMVCAHGIGLVGAMIFAFVFALLYKSIPGKCFVKGIVYGVLVWALGSLIGVTTMSCYMTISYVVVLYWVLAHLVFNVITGAIVGLIYCEKTKGKSRRK